MGTDPESDPPAARVRPRVLALALVLIASVVVAVAAARGPDARRAAAVTSAGVTFATRGPTTSHGATSTRSATPTSAVPATSGRPATPGRTTTAPTTPSTTTPSRTATTSSPTATSQVVAGAMPTSFTMSGSRFTIRADVCSVPAGFPLRPRGDPRTTVCLVGAGFGVPPGSATATSYLLGYASPGDARYVLDPAATPATAELLGAKTTRRDGVATRTVHVLDGYRIRLTTPKGTLTYRVRSTFGVASDQLGRVSSAMDQTVPKRVVLITSALAAVGGVAWNLVVFAYLESAVPAR